MENFNYIILSEDSTHHWGPINVKNKVVLDLGCGRHDTTTLESSSPIYLGLSGATKVIAVDQRQSEIDYFNSNNPDSNKYEFICKAISSTDDIRYFISKYNPEVIKCDIEEYEKYFFDISKEELNNVSEFALEYHTIDIFNTMVKKFNEWGFIIHTRAYFGFVYAPQMGVIFGSKNKMNLLSICIPTYGMHGKGKDFLEFSFCKLKDQTFKNFEIIVSDHSIENDIEDLCKSWQNKLTIKYFRNKQNIGSSSSNINNAISKSRGEWVKILFQDDFLFSNNSLEKIKNFISNNNDMDWFACACEHSFDGVIMSRAFYPKWNDYIHLGNNTISSPSVICFKKTNDQILFDDKLIWLMDVDFYKKMYKRYGEPKILNDIIVVNRLWENSVSSNMPQAIKDSELLIMMNRYNK